MVNFNASEKYPELLSVFKGKASSEQLKKRIIEYLGVITPSVIENHVRIMVQFGYIELSKTENNIFIIKAKP